MQVNKTRPLEWQTKILFILQKHKVFMQTNKFILFNPKLNVHIILLHKQTKLNTKAFYDYKSYVLIKLI